MSEALHLDLNQVKPVENLEKPNLKKLIKELHLKELKKADEEGKKLFSQVQKKQEEISYLQKVIQAINAAVNDKGELDLTHNTQLKEMLKEAEDRFGLKVPPNKLKYNSSEWQRLVDNTKLMVDDGNAEVQLKLNEANRVNNKLSEIIKVFDAILKGMHHAIEDTIRNIK